MRKIALTLACVACARCRLQAHNQQEQLHRTPCRDSHSKVPHCNDLKAILMLLLAFDPTAAFKASGLGRLSHRGGPSFPGSRHLVWNRHKQLSNGIHVLMSDSDQSTPQVEGSKKQCPTYQCFCNAAVIDPRDGSTVPLLKDVESRTKLVIVLPQLGEFDSSEFCEQLVAVDEELSRASLELLVIGIGDAAAAKRFSQFTGLDMAKLRVDPEARLHRELGLHTGPGWSTPDFIPDSVLAFLLSTLPGGKPEKEGLLRPWFDAWLNYLAMCAGIAAPGTLPEILRGYFGDKSAPERFARDAVVTAGPVKIGPGVGPVKLGPISYNQGWAEEVGYQRPIELATVRLRNMVEVLSNWNEYVSDPRHIAMRGATYIFDADGTSLYEYRHRGVLTYSMTMSRPLTFLAPYIGAKALNPLGFGDMSVACQPAEPVEFI